MNFFVFVLIRKRLTFSSVCFKTIHYCTNYFWMDVLSQFTPINVIKKHIKLQIPFISSLWNSLLYGIHVRSKKFQPNDNEFINEWMSHRLCIPRNVFSIYINFLFFLFVQRCSKTLTLKSCTHSDCRNMWLQNMALFY